MLGAEEIDAQKEKLCPKFFFPQVAHDGLKHKTMLDAGLLYCSRKFVCNFHGQEDG